MNWHAVFGKTGTEDAIEKFIHYHLDSRECRTFIPKRRITEVRQGKAYQTVKTLFPGYVLIKTCMDAKKYNILKAIPPIYSVVNQAGEYYSEIRDEEIQPLLSLSQNGNIIDYSRILIQNSRVHVTSGPLIGMEGFIRKVDKRRGRAKVALNFMGQIKTVDLRVEIVTPLN
jgi:transcriptional antiterminator NusG